MGKDELAAFLKERDEVLLSLDVDKAIAFYNKWNDVVRPVSREVAEIGMHKARTAAKSLPREARMLSANWLRERGFKTYDDGDLSQ